MNKLFVDIETFCEVPINYGTHAYAEQAEVMLFAWAVDAGPVTVWDCTAFAEPPQALLDDIARADEIVAHNSHFDRTVLRHAMPELSELLSPGGTADRWRDTMVKAYSLSLPGALGDLCTVLGIKADKAKDKEGRSLIQLFCKPNRHGARNTSDTHPSEWKKFVSYASHDIEAMREVDRILPDWNYKDKELELWRLDQKINDRGICIDLDLVNAAVRAASAEQERLTKRTQDATDGEVGSAMQRDAVLEYLLEKYGVDLPDLKGATLEKRLNDENLPPEVKELLALRLASSTTSTAKYKRIAQAVSSDGRLRNTLQFAGAARTGRWAGRLVQMQNLAKGVLKADQIETYIDALKHDCVDLI